MEVTVKVGNYSEQVRHINTGMMRTHVADRHAVEYFYYVKFAKL